MNRRNYARELERIIEKNNASKPSVVLHACCGPCSTSVLEYLSQYFDITVLFYNPNIYPEQEYQKRLDNLKEVLMKMGLDGSVKLKSAQYNHDEYLKCISAELACEPEGGKRCKTCFELRLKKTADEAKNMGADYFCSTLTVSRHKDAVLINSIGEEIAKDLDIKWLPNEFKKKNGENRSQQLSELFGIYRQLYCGCEFSHEKRDRK